MAVIARPRAAHAALLAVVLGLSVASAASADVYQVDRWPTTTYYRHDFDSSVSGSGVIRVTAVDRYELFVNGTAVGSDTLWTTADEYALAFENGTNEIAVVVQHKGSGHGTGLMLELEVGEERVVSEVAGEWYWTGVPPSGDGWLTADVASDDAWQRVQNGTLISSQVSGFQNLRVQAIGGFPGSVDVGQHEQGGLQLRLLDGENLAAGASASPSDVTDGSLKTSWSPGANALNQFARIDLGRRRRITRVRVVTAGKDAEEYESNSLRGYSVQVSEDRSRWTEVVALFGITDYEETEVSFPAVETRHIRVVVAQVARGSSPKVAEIEVYGEGYAEGGEHVSGVLDFGAPAGLKNFGRALWEAEVPDRTGFTLQFRTARDDTVWSEWGVPRAESGLYVDAPEPGVFLQYRVNLSTADNQRTPLLRSLQLEFDSAPVAAEFAQGAIEPRRVPMGMDTTFTYRLDLAFSQDDAGIETLIIDVPGWTEAAGPVQEIGGATVEARTAFDVATHEYVVVFSPPIVPADNISTLLIPFTTAQYTAQFDYRARLLAPGDSNPLNASENIDTDQATGEARSWSVSVSEVLDDVLIRARPNPRVVSPDGDGRCDYTVIEFVVAKISTPQAVQIRLFDLKGRLVRALPEARLAAGTYLHPGDNALAISAPGYWDGTDDNGELLPPGLYVYQVKIDTGGESDATKSGAVVVSY